MLSCSTPRKGKGGEGGGGGRGGAERKGREEGEWGGKDGYRESFIHLDNVGFAALTNSFVTVQVKPV